jgi:hypothetical protein
MPPPTPVPRITANTTAAPAPAPSVASDRARQFASLAMRTARPRAASRSACKRWPFRHTEFEFFSLPSCISVPGVPMPTLAPGVPSSDSAARTSAQIASSVAA